MELLEMLASIIFSLSLQTHITCLFLARLYIHILTAYSVLNSSFHNCCKVWGGQPNLFTTLFWQVFLKFSFDLHEKEGKHDRLLRTILYSLYGRKVLSAVLTLVYCLCFVLNMYVCLDLRQSYMVRSIYISWL